MPQYQNFSFKAAVAICRRTEHGPRCGGDSGTSHTARRAARQGERHDGHLAGEDPRAGARRRVNDERHGDWHYGPRGVLKIRFGISLLTCRIQIDFGGNNGELD
jgi:hypothetical protein